MKCMVVRRSLQRVTYLCRADITDPIVQKAPTTTRSGDKRKWIYTTETTTHAPNPTIPLRSQLLAKEYFKMDEKDF